MRKTVPALVLVPILLVVCVVWYCCKLRRRRRASTSNLQVLLADTIEGEFSDPILNRTVDPSENCPYDHSIGSSYYPPGSYPYTNDVYRTTTDSDQPPYPVNPTVYPVGATPHPPPPHPYPSATYSYSSSYSIDSSGCPDASSYVVTLNQFPPSHYPFDPYSHQYVEGTPPDKVDQFGTTQHAEASYHQSYSPEPSAHDSAQTSVHSDASPQHCRAPELQQLQKSIRASEVPCRPDASIPQTASSNLPSEYHAYSNKQEADGSKNSIMSEDNLRDLSSKQPEESRNSTSPAKRTDESPARLNEDSPKEDSQTLPFKFVSGQQVGSMFQSSKTSGSLFPTSSNTGSLYRPRTVSGSSYKPSTNLTAQATHGKILPPSTVTSSTSESLTVDPSVSSEDVDPTASA